MKIKVINKIKFVDNAYYLQVYSLRFFFTDKIELIYIFMIIFIIVWKKYIK